MKANYEEMVNGMRELVRTWRLESHDAGCAVHEETGGYCAALGNCAADLADLLELHGLAPYKVGHGGAK